MRVIWTSWAHVWRLRSLFLGTGYDITIPLIVTLSLASEPEPPLLPGTLTRTLPCSGTSVMWLTKLSARWRGSDNSSNGWMTLHTCKWRCKLPSTRRLAWCMTSSVTLGLTLMLKSCKGSSRTYKFPPWFCDWSELNEFRKVPQWHRHSHQSQILSCCRPKPTDGHWQATREPGVPEPLSVGSTARTWPDVEICWACHLTYT
jgi:hypothetical protein